MEGLGRYIEPTGLWNLLEEIHRVVWKIPIQLMPAILMEGPAYRIDAASGTDSIDLGDLEGLIGPYYRIDLWWKSIEFHGAVWRIILQYRRLDLVGPVGLCCCCSCGTLHSRFGSICGP